MMDDLGIAVFWLAVFVVDSTLVVSNITALSRKLAAFYYLDFFVFKRYPVFFIPGIILL